MPVVQQFFVVCKSVIHKIRISDPKTKLKCQETRISELVNAMRKLQDTNDVECRWRREARNRRSTLCLGLLCTPWCGTRFHFMVRFLQINRPTFAYHRNFSRIAAFCALCKVTSAAKDWPWCDKAIERFTAFLIAVFTDNIPLLKAFRIGWGNKMGERAPMKVITYVEVSVLSKSMQMHDQHTGQLEPVMSLLKSLGSD